MISQMREYGKYSTFCNLFGVYSSSEMHLIFVFLVMQLITTGEKIKNQLALVLTLGLYVIIGVVSQAAHSSTLFSKCQPSLLNF